MAQERNARAISDFFRFSELGDMVAGRIREFRTSKNGPFVIFEPAFIRNGRKGEVVRWANVAVSLSTDLRLKVDDRLDKGKFMTFVFNESEPTKHDSDKKIFRVLELSAKEIDQLGILANDEHKNEPYRVPAMTSSDEFGDEPGEVDESELDWLK